MGVGKLRLRHVLIISAVILASETAHALPSSDPFASSTAITKTDSKNNNEGALVIFAEPIEAQPNSFGFLDDNGSDQGRLVETTASGSYDSENLHQVSWKDSKQRSTRNYHRKACLMTALVAFLWSPLAKHILPTDSGTVCTLVWIRVIAHLFYLLECGLCSTRKYLSNSLSPSEWTDYMAQLKEAEPEILWVVRCYHYRHVRRRSSNGRTTTHRQKVVTHTAREIFDVGNRDNWRDVTSTDTAERAMQSGGDDSATFLRATLAKLFVFTNPSVGERYFVQEALFKQREGRRDVHSEFSRYIRLDNFRHKVLVVRTGLSDVAFASKLWFWVTSCLGLTVPYRIWFSRHCQPTELTVTKEIDG
jgi:hypothetical protein